MDALMEYLGPDGRNEMLEATQRLLENLEKDVQILEVDSDGKYHLIEPEEAPESETPKNTSEA